MAEEVGHLRRLGPGDAAQHKIQRGFHVRAIAFGGKSKGLVDLGALLLVGVSLRLPGSQFQVMPGQCGGVVLLYLAGSDHSDIDKEEGLVVVFRTKLQVQHTEAGLDTVDAAGGSGDIEVVVCKARTDAVVDYHALLIGHQSVTRAPHRLLEEGEGVESVEKFGGIRAAHVEATEGGYINQAVIISQDTDGMTHPAEIDMGWAIARSKPFFVGKRSLEILEAQPPKRKLVGFTLPAVASKPLEGHLVLRGADIGGNVTSCEYSQTLGQIIGLAYAGADKSTPGSQIPIRVEGGEVVHATVVTLPFFDPDTQRQEL